MRTLLIIGTGGFIGSVFRYLLARMIQLKAGGIFPAGTLTVNVIGCLVIGMILGWSEKSGLTPEWRFFLATGLCGGFTTFSAFSDETAALLRAGNTSIALIYVSASIITGLAATFAGYSLFKI